MANLAFFGTPSFAVPSLKKVHEFCVSKKHTLSFVVCQPDKPVGRGRVMQAPPVKAYAKEQGIPCLQPSTLKKNTKEGDEFFEFMSQKDIDLAIVVAYGRILPTRLLNLPTRGFVNVHASLLPRHRGAAPIQRAIEEGDHETGVSIMQVTPELDTGDVYRMESIPIEKDDTSLSLSDKLAELGAVTLADCLSGILSNTMKATPQPSSGITYASMLSKEEGQIDWGQSTSRILAKHRAMHPWPGSFSYHKDNLIKLFDLEKADFDNGVDTASPGEVLSTVPLIIAAQDGAILVNEAQLPSKKRMPIKELIKGYKIEIGDVFG